MEFFLSCIISKNKILAITFHRFDSQGVPDSVVVSAQIKTAFFNFMNICVLF